MKIDTKKQSLQNFADNFGLTVKHYFHPDARKKIKYILVKNGCSVSPPLDYSEMNCFLNGIYNAIKFDIKKHGYIDFEKELLN